LLVGALVVSVPSVSVCDSTTVLCEFLSVDRDVLESLPRSDNAPSSVHGRAQENDLQPKVRPHSTDSSKRTPGYKAPAPAPRSEFAGGGIIRVTRGRGRPRLLLALELLVRVERDRLEVQSVFVGARRGKAVSRLAILRSQLVSPHVECGWTVQTSLLVAIERTTMSGTRK
jgi:hypothetical protein